MRDTEQRLLREKATFGAGCFWNVEEAFRNLPGVIATTVGFSGGGVPEPSYERVCMGNTGHAEAVTIEYDPSRISYEDLLHVFWEIHDPTEVNRQGPDIGEQYRSVIFFHNQEQKTLAERSRNELEERGVYNRPIATTIVPVSDFYKAEEYHQKYIAKQQGDV